MKTISAGLEDTLRVEAQNGYYLCCPVAAQMSLLEGKESALHSWTVDIFFLPFACHQDIHLGEYPGVKDGWMGIVSSQGQSLLSLDISCSDVTDSGLCLLKNCSNIQSLKCNYCDQISDCGLEHISGKYLWLLLHAIKCELSADLKKLESLNIKYCNCVTDADMVPLSGWLHLDTSCRDYCNFS
ncbi:hypothetical protein BHE74_00021013 [Ensete ventricosum]|nr:hypothetical protein BHE74_00021013 [Ensete ventricosum]